MPVVIFTDGWQSDNSEKAMLGHGAVMYDPRDQALEHFGDMVKSSTAAEWRAAGGKHMVIYPCELLPCVLARRVWRERVRGRWR